MEEYTAKQFSSFLNEIRKTNIVIIKKQMLRFSDLSDNLMVQETDTTVMLIDKDHSRVYDFILCSYPPGVTNRVKLFTVS